MRNRSDQGRHVCEARCRGQAELVVHVADHVQEASGLGERLTAGVRDVREHPLHPGGVGAQQVLRRGRLHHHGADGVGDHVVQLARDAVPLGTDGLLPDLFLGGRQGGRLVGETAGDAAEDERRDRQRQHEHHVRPVAVVADGQVHDARVTVITAHSTPPRRGA